MLKMRATQDGILKLIEDLPGELIMAEVGCYAGESTMLFLNSRKVKELYAIDPWSSVYISTYGGREADNYKYGVLDSTTPNALMKAEMVYRDMYLAEKLFDKKTKGYPVVKLKATMEDAFDRLPELNFVYLDGDHNYEAVKLHISLSLQKLKLSGIIAGHDYKPKYKEGVIRAVNEIFGEPDKIYPDFSWIIFKPHKDLKIFK